MLSEYLNRLYKKLDRQTSQKFEPLPRIGISSNRKDGTSCIAEPYFQSVILAGGVPILIPVTNDVEVLAGIIENIDGLVFSGGGDLTPTYLGEEAIEELGETDPLRDEYDLLLLKLAFNRGVPIFGICRGHQLINAAFGGTLYQDIHTQFSHAALRHSQEEARDVATHTVTLTDGPSKLRTALSIEQNTLLVNSFHHQAIKDLAPEFMATAAASDGLNEAMEHPEYPIFSVQWHPEPMAVVGNEAMLNLFRYHVGQAAVYTKAKKLHHKILTIDSHTDTPMIFKHFNLSKKEGGKVNLPLMEEGRLDAAFMVAYIPQGERDDAALKIAHEYAMERLEYIIKQTDFHHDRVGIAKNGYEALQLKREGKKALFLGVENGYAIGKELSNIQHFKSIGISYITLCHNGDNDICDSAAGKAEWGGLSPFGRDVVAEMNRLGIMVDVSHAAESTFYDALQCSKVPIIASHSSCRALCNHRRNLDDDQIKALAAKGGVMQICLYKGFINENSEQASLCDAVKHICHAVKLVGINHVGIGSDFDGDGELIGCRAANELIQITMRLIAEGFDDKDIERIWGGNLMRVMAETQAAIAP